MKRWQFACLLGLILTCHSALALEPTMLQFGSLGKTLVYSGGSRQLTLVLSDEAHWATAQAAARTLAQRGETAALASYDHFMQHVAESGGQCIEMHTLLDVYSQAVQKQGYFEHYVRPYLLAYGAAASYLYVMLSETPAGIFQGGFSLARDDAHLQMPVPPCDRRAAVSWVAASKPVQVLSGQTIATPWAASFDVDLAGLPPRTAGVPADWLAQFDHFTAGTRPHAAVASSAAGGQMAVDVSDLPLVEVPRDPQAPRQPLFAIILSGDGGWANIDKDIGNALAARGVDVTGWNSLQYFWKGKTPERASADLAQVITAYRQKWGASRVLLVGFSMGADVLPFMVSRLSLADRQSIAGLVLLSPSPSVDFTFHLSGWLNNGGSSPYALKPELPRIADVPVQCVYGADDDDSLCPLLTQGANLQIIRLAGDHHFDGDYDKVVELMLKPVLPGNHQQLPVKGE